MRGDAAATRDALDAIRRAPSLLAAMDLFDDLAAAVRAEAHCADGILASAIGDSDQLLNIAAVHAAAAAGKELASSLVVPLLDSPNPSLREHAAWALASSPRIDKAVHALSTLAAEGGFSGMLAENTLETWGDIPPDPEDTFPSPIVPASNDAEQGLTVAQLFLHAEIDGRLEHAGQGDTGGIATLLVHLGDALLAERPAVARILTLSRGDCCGDPDPEALARPGHHYLSVPLPGPAMNVGTAWPLRVPARRGIRRLLRLAGRVDVLHLRMADVGSWVAAEVARELGIPTVLTLAPDPHALIAAREASDTLTRTNFGAADLAEHLVFRVRLLRDLAAQAAHLVVFPRPDLERDLRELLSVDPVRESGRISVVPEGVDLAPLERADIEVSDALRGAPVPPSTVEALTALDAALATLPEERRGLPLAITVGRLHRVKGVATLVEAWASHQELSSRCNLLVVGGDLDQPNGEEEQQLDRIDSLIPRSDGPRRGLLLAGHRPNPMVATWLAASRHGRPGLCAPHGVYVSASLKEEFGLAILEAMASGLVVVAPVAGGPSTYVEDGITGVLADTGSPDALAAAVASALDLAAAPDADARAARAHSLLADRFSIQTMASALSTIYAKVAHDTARHQS